MQRRLTLCVVLGLALISLACFALPMFVIRPFRHQGATELALALTLKQMGPLLSAACAVLTSVIVATSWRALRGWRTRSAFVFALATAIGSACLVRLNVYELMFHPLGAPHFQSIRDSHIDNDDMVIAVRLNGDSRAYPIREMAYHHIVNDTVGGEPIVSTY